MRRRREAYIKGPWSDDELDRLERLKTKTTMTWTEISGLMNRPEQNLRSRWSRINRFGRPKPTGKTRGYAFTHQIEAACREGITTPRALAKHLDRTFVSMRAALYKRGLDQEAREFLAREATDQESV